MASTPRLFVRPSSSSSSTMLRRAGAAALKVDLAPVRSPEYSRALRCCLIGPTNAGKSTLLNALVNTRVAAVSPKIHTKRVNTLGYLTDQEMVTQVEFLDAPGALGPDVPALHQEIWEAVSHAELAMVVVDADDRLTHRQVRTFLGRLAHELRQQEIDGAAAALQAPQEASVERGVDVRDHDGLTAGDAAGDAMGATDGGSSGRLDGGASVVPAASAFGGRRLSYDGAARPPRRLQTALVLNKVDRVHPKTRLLKVSRELHADFDFDWPPFMVSATTGSGIPHLKNFLLNFARPGRWMVPPGVTSVEPPLVRATEIIREQIFKYFDQELPYLIEQRNIAWTEVPITDDRGHRQMALRIDQQLILPRKRKSVKRIVEKRIAGIATEARKALRDEFGRVVFLHLSTGEAGGAEVDVAELAEVKVDLGPVER